MTDYNSDYYESNEQSGDRKALEFYDKLFARYMGGGSKDRQVLEYGSGVGHLTKRLVKRYKTTALDISTYALSKVKEHAPEAKTTKTISSIKDGTLDGIIALHVLEHIKDPSITFRDYYEKLKDGGLLFYVVPNPDGWGHKLKKEKWFGFTDDTHISLFSEKKWLSLTKKGNFEIVRIKGDGMWDAPYLPILPTILQKLIFLPPAVVQVLLSRVFLPTKMGECLVVVARKKSKTVK